VNDSGWSQPHPANAFSSVSALRLLELKARTDHGMDKEDLCAWEERRNWRGHAFQVSQENIKLRAKGRGA